MSEEHIIDQARRRIAARQAAQAQAYWEVLPAWLLPVLVVLVLVGFLVVPLPLPAKLLIAMSGLCELRPSHSYYAGALQLPLEARMLGIFAGALITFLALLAARRVGARHLGSRATIGLLALAFTAMVFDGVNSTLENLGRSHLYAPTNEVRLATGLLAGLTIAVMLSWLLGAVATKRMGIARRAVIRAPVELVVPLAILALFYAVVTREQSVGYYPIALLGVGGVVVVVACAAMLFILNIGGLAGHITRARQLLAPAALALLFAFGIIAGAAALRWNALGG